MDDTKNNPNAAGETKTDKDSRNDPAPALAAGDFARMAAAVMARIEQVIVDADIDADAALISDGVLEVEFADGGKMVVNRHEASREIWVAGRSGAFHFRWNGDDWVDTRGGESWTTVLARLVNAMSGKTLSFA